LKTALICHHDDDLNRVALPRWLASFSDVVGIVVIRENAQQQRNRIRRELKRVGYLRFLDVLGYRLYHRSILHHRDLQYERQSLNNMAQAYRPLPPDVPIIETDRPNSSQARDFLQNAQPELVIARCKVILKPEIFQIPRLGTYVMHPGICPEYRNAHGCFWALAENDLKNVGMTLLRIDKGIDTGPVYGYFSHPYDECAESHIVIQHRTVFDNLDQIRDKLLEIEKGIATPLDTSERKSGNWGQPWLTRYLRWKRAARKRAGEYEPNIAALP
jgi:hypothetical protein